MTEKYPEWATIEYNTPRVVVEDRDGSGLRLSVRYLEKSILGYLPITNGQWFRRNWIDVTTFGHPPDVRIFIDGGSDE